MIARLRCAFTVVAVTACAATAGAQPPTSKSAPLAADLSQRLQTLELQTIAAKDPERPGFYVAASYISGVQLLVVLAHSTATDYIEYMLASSRYDEVYSTLNAASTREGKLFVQDMGADGLADGRGKGARTDVVYRDEVTTTVFNGDWKSQGMNERQYDEAFQEIDAQYARGLSLLLEQLKR
ncbi:MAG TPA: hypothetical protein VK911_12205 [Vicinamibacterales bacterium]|nr:hypothetical protein [Vicinamibacterales bacterium]